MNESDVKYLKILEEAKNDPAVVGLIFGGSRGKSVEFLTTNSDYDVILIVSNDTSDELKKKMENYKSPEFEIWVRTVDEFRDYAKWGSNEDWDRYNYTHNKAIIDKTGDVQTLIDEKGILPSEVQKNVVESTLDDYINQVYRSAKYYRDGNNLAAHIDATESLPPLMTALYALEGRLKPYNKYFEWELKNYPLKLFPWNLEEFISDYKHILATGNIETQKKIFYAVKKLFRENGYSKSIDGWKDYYFVGD